MIDLSPQFPKTTIHFPIDTATANPPNATKKPPKPPPSIPPQAYTPSLYLGIGKATAFAFAKHGVQRLALSDRSPSALHVAASELQSRFPSVEIQQLAIDVTKDEEIDRGVADAVAAFGRIDIAVNNAGISGAGKATHEATSSDWQSVIGVNLSGVWKSQRRVVQQMLTHESLSVREGKGAIVNVASMYGLVGPPGHIAATAYTASKHGVLGLTKAVSPD